MERLIDAAARQTGIDPVELRRRNLIAPAQFPTRARSARCSTVAISPPLIDEALARADGAGFAARRARSEAAGKRRGLGVGCFLEIAGGQPGEGAKIAFPGGSQLLLAIGIGPSGQGHATLYRRLAAERLGIPVDQVDFAHGDSDSGVPSAGAVASRSTMSVGSAVVRDDRRGDRKGQARRRPYPRSRRGRHRLSRRRVRDLRHRPPRRLVRSRRDRREAGARGGARRKPRHPAHCRRCCPRSPTAATSPRSRSIPRPGRSRSPPTPRSTIAGGYCSRCWSRARCRAASPRGSDRR